MGWFLYGSNTEGECGLVLMTSYHAESSGSSLRLVLSLIGFRPIHLSLTVALRCIRQKLLFVTKDFLRPPYSFESLLASSFIHVPGPRA